LVLSGTVHAYINFVYPWIYSVAGKTNISKKKKYAKQTCNEGVKFAELIFSLQDFQEILDLITKDAFTDDKVNELQDKASNAHAYLKFLYIT